jgi:hypothetical protein
MCSRLPIHVPGHDNWARRWFERLAPNEPFPLDVLQAEIDEIWERDQRHDFPEWVDLGGEGG